VADNRKEKDGALLKEAAKMRRRIFPVLLMIFMALSLGGPSLCEAQPLAYPEESVDEQPKSRAAGADAAFFDAVLMRPAGVVACAAGLTASIIALPFALISGSQQQMYETLIATPFEFTFKRPLGEGAP
jgi:hypothetical protein